MTSLPGCCHGSACFATEPAMFSQQPSMIEPVHPFQGGIFHGVDRFPGPSWINDLGLKQAGDRLGQCIVIRIDTFGWLLVLNGETSRGLVLLQEVRSKAPHITDIHYHLMVALERAGRNDEIRKELNRLLRSSKEFPERDKAEALQDKPGGQVTAVTGNTMLQAVINITDLQHFFSQDRTQ